MRSLFLVVLLVVALYLVSHSADGDVSLNLINPSSKIYNDFIESVRNALRGDYTRLVFGIPVLRKTASGSARYLSAQLTSQTGRTITLGFDVVNSYVLGYEVGKQAYYLNDTSPDAYKYLFQNSTRNVLLYGGTYPNLVFAADIKKGRGSVALGITEIGIAIDHMFFKSDKKLVARGFIVLIQAVSEASRFKDIQKEFSKNLYTPFMPGSKFLDLQNNWGSLSEQILIAENNKGIFNRSITIDKTQVTNVNSSIVKEMGLLLNEKAKLVYDHDDILFMPNDRDTNTAAIAMETASYRYSYANRKSFLNPAREAIAAM